MKEIIVVLDDTRPVSSTVKRILNKERYSEIVLKKIKLANMFEISFKEYIDSFYLIKTEEEKKQFEISLNSMKQSNVVIMYVPSSIVIVNNDLFANLLKKIRFLNG